MTAIYCLLRKARRRRARTKRTTHGTLTRRLHAFRLRLSLASLERRRRTAA